MKSTINTLADYREAPFQREVILRCPESYLQTQMRHLTRSKKHTEPVSQVEKGDVVLLSLQSDLPRFSRPVVPVTVGGNLFDAELEAQLIGHQAGETFSVAMQDAAVTVTILRADRTIFPEPTDEMVAAYAASHEGFEQVNTVAEYRDRVIQNYMAEERQRVLFDAMDQVLDYVLTHSDWNFDEEEVEARMAQAKAEINQDLQSKNKTLDTLTDEELRSSFGVGTHEELELEMRHAMERDIASELWLMSIHGKQSMEEIEGYPWDFMQDFVTQNLKITEEK
jgi:FKBP-type peptidyl-prolyl cis-trans isomerase (trigger factor)